MEGEKKAKRVSRKLTDLPNEILAEVFTWSNLQEMCQNYSLVNKNLDRTVDIIFNNFGEKGIKSYFYPLFRSFVERRDENGYGIFDVSYYSRKKTWKSILLGFYIKNIERLRIENATLKDVKELKKKLNELSLCKLKYLDLWDKNKVSDGNESDLLEEQQNLLCFSIKLMVKKVLSTIKDEVFVNILQKIKKEHLALDIKFRANSIENSHSKDME